MTDHFDNIEHCADAIVQQVGKKLIVGTPLGLGKANLLLNALYQRALADKEIELSIFTALTLEIPQASSELEKRFLKPLLKRWFDGYPELDYAVARSAGQLPDNVTVHEFFLSPAKFLNNNGAQQDYISSNYTHVARDMLSRGVNVVVQMVSPGTGDHKNRYSLSCNPDVTLELIPKMRATGRNVFCVGESNAQLPYLYGDADVEETIFDAIVTPPSYTLFGTPKSSVGVRDYMIGLHAGALVKDDGTLQVGIGSLGDAVAYCLGLRHEENALYRQIIEKISTPQSLLVQQHIGEDKTFKHGLYGATEMFVDGFLYLFDKGILSRKVYEDPVVQDLLNKNIIQQEISLDTLDQLEEHHGFRYPLDQRTANYLKNIGVIHADAVITQDAISIAGKSVQLDELRVKVRAFISQHALGSELADPSVLHGGFYLGDQSFYKRLRELPEADRQLLKMTSVDRINQLYRGETLDRLQRHNARFINTCLMVTLNGTVVSDGLDNNKVLSGVGGQYNFVAMAHALDQSRSIIKLRSTYQSSDGLRSNIVLNYGHATIPRHLRDVVVTEYGSADLRGRTERECAKALINIADSRFQLELLDQAKAAGKIEGEYQIDPVYRQNNPERLQNILKTHQENGLFPSFPFGTDLSDDELILGAALKRLKTLTGTRYGMIRQIFKAWIATSTTGKERLLQRMDLAQPQSIKDKTYQRLVASVLD